MHILIIDDDGDSGNVMKLFLEKEGFVVHCTLTGADGIQLVRQIRPDLVILDVLLPEMDGRDVCQHIRNFSDVPILMISAYVTQVGDIVQGLNLGADDYLPKPLNFDLLKAKITVLLRHHNKAATAQSEGGVYVDPYLMIDLRQQYVCVAGQRLSLSPLEYHLLEILIRNEGQAVPMVEIIEDLWPTSDGDTLEHTVRNYIKRLRNLVEHDPANPSYILNERGFGYKFDPR